MTDSKLNPGRGYVSVPVEPTPEMLEPFARVLCSALDIDPDEPEAPHGEWPTWYGQCGPLASAYRDSLAAAPAVAPALDGEMREAIAKTLWERGKHKTDFETYDEDPETKEWMLGHADAILAVLRPGGAK